MSDKPRLPQKNGADPKKDGFLRMEDVIEHLAGEYRLRRDGDSNCCSLVHIVGRVRDDTVLQLLEDGWLDSFPNGGGYELSDLGRLSYIRSTDELGDGELRPPSSADEGREKL